jgi:hypothetical protein
VFERLAAGEPLTLMADGTGKALLIPITDGDVATALDAWRRGRALLALARLQTGARRSGTTTPDAAGIAKEIRDVRLSRRARESHG